MKHDTYSNNNNNVLFNSSLSRSTRVRQYQKKYSLTLCGYDTTSLINFLHFPWSIASYLHICCIWMTIFFYDLTPSFLWPALGLTPSTSKSMHFFTQSLLSFLKTCPYCLNLCHCITVIIQHIPNLSLNSLLENLSFISMPHIHLIILISAR